MMDDRIYLMRDWKFCECFAEAMITEPMTDDQSVQVDLPHTCKEVPFHYFDEHVYQMVCCYQKQIYAEETWKG